ncbi:unnamed protein product [Brugia timori]|uniref:Uncharacterized protein n=1 Tax=Brugia timori TaxID=42155 RepID=A0A3P7WEH9_9BILA|nr:unnamed protein product [Brugia timori]
MQILKETFKAGFLGLGLRLHSIIVDRTEKFDDWCQPFPKGRTTMSNYPQHEVMLYVNVWTVLVSCVIVRRTMSWRCFKRCSRRTLQAFALAFCFIGFYAIFSAPKPATMHPKGHKGMMAGAFIGNIG